MFKRNLDKQKGSSLVELIVVMTIIGIIMSIAIVGYTVFIKNAKKVKSDQELTQVYNLIYMEANQNGIEVGRNTNGNPSLYVSTSSNKIVFIFNDAPNTNLEEGWDMEDLDNWKDEANWNKLINDLIHEVTGDINMFAGRFELDPKEDTAEIVKYNDDLEEIRIVSKRHLTYILENDEELRSKKEVIVTTLRDVETITRILNDLETDQSKKLVPPGRVNSANDVTQVDFEIWVVWSAASGFVKTDEFEGILDVSFEVRLKNDALNEQELIEANNLINEEALFKIEFDFKDGNQIVSDHPEVIDVSIMFNREPKNKEEYDLIKNSQLELIFTISIGNVKIKSSEIQP